MEKTEAGYETKINGTTYKVVLESAEKAKLTYEELVRKRCQQEAEALSQEESEPVSA